MGQKDVLLHIRVPEKLKQQIDQLIEIGLFNNKAEVIREGIRELLLKYQEERSK